MGCSSQLRRAPVFLFRNIFVNAPMGHLGIVIHNFQYLYENVPQRGDSRQGWRGFHFCTDSPPERFSFFVGMHSV